MITATDADGTTIQTGDHVTTLFGDYLGIVWTISSCRCKKAHKTVHVKLSNDKMLVREGSTLRVKEWPED